MPRGCTTVSHSIGATSEIQTLQHPCSFSGSCRRRVSPCAFWFGRLCVGLEGCADGFRNHIHCVVHGSNVLDHLPELNAQHNGFGVQRASPLRPFVLDSAMLRELVFGVSWVSRSSLRSSCTRWCPKSSLEFTFFHYVTLAARNYLVLSLVKFGKSCRSSQ